MSRRSLLRTCLGAGVGLAMAFANVAQAQGEGATAAPPSGAREGIAEAKKDFDAIKSVRDAALMPTSRMPTVAVPELSLPPSPATPGTSKAKTNPRETKSSSWLVDAMQKDSSANRLRDTRTRDRKNRTGEREGDLLEENRGEPGLAANEKEAAKIERERRDQREEDATTAVVANPLNGFLGSWMTPQDYALLKPGLTPPADGGLGPKVSPLPNSTNVPIPSGGLSDLSRTGSLPPTTAISARRENPYLQSLKTEVPVTTTRRQNDVAPIAPPSRPPPAITTPPVVPPPSKIPEFAKPSSDDRYFKQLKRF